MYYFDAMVAKTTRRQRGVDCGLIADEKKRGDFFIGLKRELRARNHDSATMVAAHDIHCDSHSEKVLSFEFLVLSWKNRTAMFLQLKIQN